MKKDNPFTLTFGKKPSEYISRYENTETIISTFEAENPISQTYLIEGIRGSGKTVLMTTITKILEESKEWIVIDLNSTQNLIEDFAMRLSDACAQLGEISPEISLSVGAVGLNVSGNSPLKDNISVIERILSSLKKKKKKVVITIDEVLHDSNMRHFASEFQIFIRKDYPLFLIMTGLYENIYAIQNDPALTFLLRAPKIKLEPLSIRQITMQYKNIFDISIDEAKQFASITKGYAFAFQAFGMLYWEYREQLSLDEILIKFDDMLDDFVYKKIWESLSPQDRNILLSFTDYNMKVKDICDSLSLTSSTFSKYRERLIKKGIIISNQHGYVTLTLPRFIDVIKYYEIS